MSSEILLNDLPKYSLWPLRLMGLEPWEPKKKVAAELIREFEQEKWGPLWEHVRNSLRQVKLSDIEDLVFHSSEEQICFDEGKLVKMTSREAFLKQYGRQLAVIKKYLSSIALVELGAGYGQIILNIAQEDAFKSLPLFSGEYTDSGMALIRSLAKSQGIKMAVGHCDFDSDIITSLPIPTGATIFTSYSAHYVPTYNRNFIDTIVSWQPSTVVHFEPLYEVCDESTILGAMQRRYIQMSDYSRNLLEVIKEAEYRGEIEIVELETQVFGSNPFLPFSVVVWKPK